MQPTAPNIVFMMSDDHAAHAISAYGSRINDTPNLDRIADLVEIINVWDDTTFSGTHG